MNKPDQFVDDDGKECFTCAVCRETFYSAPDFPEEERVKEMNEVCPPPSPDEPIRSVCHDCWTRIHGSFAAAAEYVKRGAAVVPVPSGVVLPFTRTEALELLGMPPDGKETKPNQYVQIVQPPDDAE